MTGEMSRVACEAHWIAVLADVVCRLREAQAERLACGDPMPPQVAELAAQVGAELRTVRPEGKAVAIEMLRGLDGFEDLC